MIQKSNELYHYGVLGMKWGVRRTPEQLGKHKIRKGTTMYRSTADSNESTSGHKYVTFLKVDRDLYRGAYANEIAKNSEKFDGKVYENVYKLKEDLKIPSRNEVKEVIHELRNRDANYKMAVENGRAYCLMKFKNNGRDSYYENIEEYFVTSKEKMPDDYDKAREKAIKGTMYKFLNKYKDQPIDGLFRDTVSSFGLSEANRTAVINELKKRGYNAMVDEAGVGGNNMWHPREGVEPLIIFDGDSSLKKVSTSAIDDKTMNKAYKRHSNWYFKANDPRNRNDRNPW